MSRNASIETRSPAARRSLFARGGFLIGVVAGILAAGVALWNLRSRQIEPSPPHITTAHILPEHREKLEAFRKDVLARPKSAESWGRYGMLLRALDFHPQAAGCFRRAERLDRTDARWPYFLARSLLTEDPAQAVESLRRSVALCGNEPEIPRYLLAKALAERGEWNQADLEIAALLQARPNFSPARLLRAYAAADRGNLATAADLARHSTDDPRTRKSAWALLAKVYQRQGKTNEAVAAARTSSSLPGDESVYDPFEVQVVAFRGDARSLADQVPALLSARKLPEAEHLIQRLLAEHPTFPEAWLLLGRLCYLQKDFPSAETALQKHLQLDPQSAHGCFQLGMVQLGAQKFIAAADTFGRATELKSDFGPAWFNRGYALGRAGRLAQSAEAFQQAIRHNPEHFESYLLLADVQLQLGNTAEAADLLATAENLDPADRRIPPLRAKIERILSRAAAPAR